MCLNGLYYSFQKKIFLLFCFAVFLWFVWLLVFKFGFDLRGRLQGPRADTRIWREISGFGMHDAKSMKNQ